MPLFENGSKKAARTELERAIREIEEKNKRTLVEQELNRKIEALNSNINFAEKLNLIAADKADHYRQRLKQIVLEFERMQDRELENLIDERYISMIEAQAKIEEEKNTQREEDYSSSSKTMDDKERIN